MESIPGWNAMKLVVLLYQDCMRLDHRKRKSGKETILEFDENLIFSENILNKTLSQVVDAIIFIFFECFI